MLKSQTSATWALVLMRNAGDAVIYATSGVSHVIVNTCLPLAAFWLRLKGSGSLGETSYKILCTSRL